MSQGDINQYNVGRIAERIVSNELEYRGFRVSDLNKEGASANADLLAAKDGKTLQIQVKGATFGSNWWVNYGFASEAKISRAKPMFNATDSFYKAEVVVLVSVKSPSEYRCVVLPIWEAERAAQLNLDHAYRPAKADGTPKKPGKAWADLNHVLKARDTSLRASISEEQDILTEYIDKWDLDMTNLKAELESRSSTHSA